MEAGRPPRITPGNRRQIGLVNSGIAWALGRATGGRPPHIFTTLARHRGLFRRWLGFAGALMPGGKLPRADSELVILRVAHNTGCEYECGHHERLGVSEVLRFDLRRHRIGVSLVCPGGVRTPLVNSVKIVGVDRQSPTGSSASSPPLMNSRCACSATASTPLQSAAERPAIAAH